ncbi:LOW QUALITY PROTEIN: uncharacterized protein LOC129576342 [Sitodiplosis mosellana]|uniref:LOW QUALITY PROTEIN: uncharacterized protein LOC129576342 n=1 Tax=Sitodiplosis mosellana TaxID=263140 RepID=UPI0024445DF2|nr:LOW QUALITY PROTEIN: uncharacterized protein LOC129576342 [Sitodiplosis mosellana]
MSANVLMTLPKYVPIPNKNGLPISADPIESFMGCGKKRRLDHLTWEEKLQRKKLKNRVAAQTSRDRKKAKMDEMDQTVKQLMEENNKLKEQFERLTADNEELLKRNIELERSLEDLQSHRLMDLGESTAQMSHKQQQQQQPNIKVESAYDAAALCDRWMGCGIINNNGSAVSSYPLPKGSQMKPQSMRRSDSTCSNYMMTQQQQQHQQTLTPPSTPPPAHQASHPFESNKRANNNSNGPRIVNGRNASEPQKQFRFSCSMEDCGSLPSLQDMLEDFDASRLEELAESLLADVTTEFEDDAKEGGHRIAQIEGKSKPMFRPMVGTQTKDLESSENTYGSLNTPTHQPSMMRTIKQETVDCMPSDDDLYVSTAPIAPAHHMQSMQMHFEHTPFDHSEQLFDDNNNSNNSNDKNTTITNANHICSTDKSMILCQSASDNSTDTDTLYETTTFNDDEGNVITVILPDEDISNFEEVIEEMNQNDEEDDCMSHLSALSPIPSNANYDASPGGYSLNSGDDAAAVSDHDSAYDSVVNSPPGKISSAWSTTSSVNCIDDDYRYYDYWPQDSFSVLFPSLA